AVVDEPVPPIGESEPAGRLLRGPEQFGDERPIVRRHIVHRRNVLFRNEQDVFLRLGLDVAERQDPVVLVHFRARNLAPDDFAEKAVRLLRHGPSTSFPLAFFSHHKTTRCPPSKKYRAASLTGRFRNARAARAYRSSCTRYFSAASLGSPVTRSVLKSTMTSPSSSSNRQSMTPWMRTVSPSSAAGASG